MMAAKENFTISMMGFVFEKLVPSLLPTDKLFCGEHSARLNHVAIFFVQYSFYFSFADLEHEIWATITISLILLFGLIIYPFSGAASLSPALKSAAK